MTSTKTVVLAAKCTEDSRQGMQALRGVGCFLRTCSGRWQRWPMLDCAYLCGFAVGLKGISWVLLLGWRRDVANPTTAQRSSQEGRAKKAMARVPQHAVGILAVEQTSSTLSKTLL